MSSAVAAPAVAVASVSDISPDTSSVSNVSASDTQTGAAPATFKIGGREYTQAELEAHLSTSSRADQILKEAAQAKAEVEQARAGLKDPGKRRAILKELGVDTVKEAEDILIEHLEQQQMTPEQRELAELKAEKAARLESEKASEAEKAAKAQEAQVAQLTAAYEQQFVEAIDSAGLPRTPDVGIQLTQIVMDAVDAGYEVSPAEAAVILKSRITEANRSVFEGMTVAQLRAALPEKAIKALIKEHTEGLKASVSKAPDGPAARRSVPKAKAASEESLEQMISRLQRSR